ncbi:hypothetical protein [Colwellia maritima]|uniref:hypothetical protein n=1 Tax=Colwellia maritima TaxID=2912588 RepID=UPI003B847D57
MKLDKNNTDLITLLRDEDGSGKVVVVDVAQEYYAVVGENLMKFAHKNNYALALSLMVIFEILFKLPIFLWRYTP